MPSASIIVPAFNARTSIGRALSAARTQSIRDLEIIVVDDGSFDGTASYVEEIAKQDERVRLFRHKSSGGPSVARNTAISQALGRWIVLLDADDAMAPDRVESLIREAELRKLDLLADNVMLMDASTSSPIGEALNPALMRRSDSLSLTDLLRADWPGRNRRFRNLGVAKPIIRRSFLTDSAVSYDPAVRLGEDLLFYSCLVASGAQFGVTDTCGYLYTTNAETISRRRSPTLELVEVNDKIRSFVRSRRAEKGEGLIELLDEREGALRFQVLTWALKVADFSLASRMVASLPLATMVKLVGEKVRERSIAAAGLSDRAHARGACRARNSGWRETRGEVLLFPDDDCWYPPGFLASGLRRMMESEAQVVTGRAADGSGRSINGRFEAQLCEVTPEMVWTTSIEWVAFFKRSVLETLGGFDENIGIGAPTPWQSCESQDIVLRALEGSFCCVYDPQLFGHHAELNITEPDEAQILKGRAYARGMGWVLRKHHVSWLKRAYWAARPVIKSAFSAIRGRMSAARYFYGVALGRWEGARGRLLR